MAVTIRWLLARSDACARRAERLLEEAGPAREASTRSLRMRWVAVVASLVASDAFAELARKAGHSRA